MDTSQIFNRPIENIVLWFVAFLFSLSVHESAHAWTSEKFGDDTGRYQGRITLNPMAHIDPIGTILIPLFGFLSSGFSFIGWAKPVETNPLSWRNKKLANICVAGAGPLSNLILATITFTIIKVLTLTRVLVLDYEGNDVYDLLRPALSGQPILGALAKLLGIMLMLNIALAIFNMIPVPPLDGSHILESLLPESAAEKYAAIRPYGFMLLLGLMYTGIFGTIIGPVYFLTYKLMGFKMAG